MLKRTYSIIEIKPAQIVATFNNFLLFFTPNATIGLLTAHKEERTIL